MRFEEAGLHRAGDSDCFGVSSGKRHNRAFVHTQVGCQGTELREFFRKPRCFG